MILRAENIAKKFDEKTVLEQVSLELDKGEIICILGESGSGKTTLFNILSGVVKPDQGQVILKQEDITGKPGKISYMLQKDMLLPYKKVIDNVSLPLRIQGINKKDARAKAGAYFKEFGIAGYEMKYPAELSGGMRQRAALLRTYLFANEVVLLDEPFSALDRMTKNALHKWYLNIVKQFELSTIFITHDIDEAILLSNRIYVLDKKNEGFIAEITIEKKGKTIDEFSLSSEFLGYKQEVGFFLE